MSESSVSGTGARASALVELTGGFGGSGLEGGVERRDPEGVKTARVPAGTDGAGAEVGAADEDSGGGIGEGVAMPSAWLGRGQSAEVVLADVPASPVTVECPTAEGAADDADAVGEEPHQAMPCAAFDEARCASTSASVQVTTRLNSSSVMILR